MRIAMLGTRGVPARYGGFETAIEEIGKRLVVRGHEVVVYCRGAERPDLDEHLGMQLVHLPAARKKALETLSHTALSTVDLWRRGPVRRGDRLQRRQRAVPAGPPRAAAPRGGARGRPRVAA